MSVVAFEQIKKVTLADALSMDLSTGVAPLDGVVDAGNRTNLYDVRWGYFLFGQSVQFRYDEAKSYVSEGVFTIRGLFTIDAEMGQADPSVTDEAAFNKVVARYQELEDLFEDCRTQPAPDDYALWGTNMDLRCLPLPEPLRDKGGRQIYARVESISVEPGQWGRYIAYRATLREAVVPLAKVHVNGTVLDRGQIGVTLPRPMIVRHRLVGCVGEVIQVENYSVMEVDVAGALPVQPGDRPFTDRAIRLLNGMEGGFAKIGTVEIASGAVKRNDIFEDYDVDSGTQTSVDLTNRETGISIKAKARI